MCGIDICRSNKVSAFFFLKRQEFPLRSNHFTLTEIWTENSLTKFSRRLYPSSRILFSILPSQTNQNLYDFRGHRINIENLPLHYRLSALLQVLGYTMEYNLQKSPTTVNAPNATSPRCNNLFSSDCRLIWILKNGDIESRRRRKLGCPGDIMALRSAPSIFLPFHFQLQTRSRAQKNKGEKKNERSEVSTGVRKYAFIQQSVVYYFEFACSRSLHPEP